MISWITSSSRQGGHPDRLLAICYENFDHRGYHILGVWVVHPHRARNITWRARARSFSDGRFVWPKLALLIEWLIEQDIKDRMEDWRGMLTNG